MVDVFSLLMWACICVSVLVNSFIELVEYLFTIPGVTVFLSNQMYQEPLEKMFFG